jgi:hypothetical protein
VWKIQIAIRENLIFGFEIPDFLSKESTGLAGGFALAPQGLTGRGFGPFLKAVSQKKFHRAPH